MISAFERRVLLVIEDASMLSAGDISSRDGATGADGLMTRLPGATNVVGCRRNLFIGSS